LDMRVVGVFRYVGQQNSFTYRPDPHLLVPVGVNRQAQMLEFVPIVAEAGSVMVVSGGAVSVSVSEKPVEGNEIGPTNLAVTSVTMPEATYSELLVKPREGMVRQSEQEIAALLRSRVEGRNQGSTFSAFGGRSEEDFDVIVADVRRDAYQFRQF